MDRWMDAWVLLESVYTQRSEVVHHSIRDSQSWLSLGSLHRQRVNVKDLCHGDKQHYTTLSLRSSVTLSTQNQTLSPIQLSVKVTCWI